MIRINTIINPTANLNSYPFTMKISGISGNEAYCLSKVGYNPGELVVGNSVYSLGVLGSLISGIRNVVGGEIVEISKFISEGRRIAVTRMEVEAQSRQAEGITGVTSDFTWQNAQNSIEFVSIGSAVHSPTNTGQLGFSTSVDGADLYCNVDAGYNPRRFVFGNVAYSIGAVKGILASLKTIGRGEIHEYSNILNHTRHIALQRIVDEAKSAGANSVLNIKTRVLPYSQGITEMLMIGTAFHNPALPQEYLSNPVTSDLTATELWSLTKMGYIPVKLLLATSVYSLGVVGQFTSFLRSFVQGEMTELTSMIYDARNHVIELLQQEAESIGADSVLGTKIYMHDLGNNILELMAVGTAVKKVSDINTKSDTLITQATILDQNTFFDYNLGMGRAFGVGDLVSGVATAIDTLT